MLKSSLRACFFITVGALTVYYHREPPQLYVPPVIAAEAEAWRASQMYALAMTPDVVRNMP
jgi:hypothetical protein